MILLLWELTRAICIGLLACSTVEASLLGTLRRLSHILSRLESTWQIIHLNQVPLSGDYFTYSH